MAIRVQKPCFCIWHERTTFALHCPEKNLLFPIAQSFFFDSKSDMRIDANSVSEILRSCPASAGMRVTYHWNRSIWLKKRVN